MVWFKREKKPLPSTSGEERRVKTEGLFTKCEGCKSIVWKKELEANQFVCSKCNYHFRIGARKRFQILLDSGRYLEFNSELQSSDPLQFFDRKPYRDRLSAAIQATGSNEAVLTAKGKLQGTDIICAAMEYHGATQAAALQNIEEKLRRNIGNILESAKRKLILPRQAAIEMAEQRVRKAMGFRRFSLYSTAPDYT